MPTTIQDDIHVRTPTQHPRILVPIPYSAICTTDRRDNNYACRADNHTRPYSCPNAKTTAMHPHTDTIQIAMHPRPQRQPPLSAVPTTIQDHIHFRPRDNLQACSANNIQVHSHRRPWKQRPPFAMPTTILDDIHPRPQKQRPWTAGRCAFTTRTQPGRPDPLRLHLRHVGTFFPTDEPDRLLTRFHALDRHTKTPNARLSSGGLADRAAPVRLIEPPLGERPADSQRRPSGTLGTCWAAALPIAPAPSGRESAGRVSTWHVTRFSRCSPSQRC